jgi:phosphoribosylglycinamide formyltransferase-1
MSGLKKKVAVLVSGNGTNLQALIDAGGRFLNAEIVLVVSSAPGANALNRAKNANIESVVLDKKNPPSGDYDNDLCVLLNSKKIDVVVLAGFLVILGSKVIEAYKNKIINIHPSLLPSFAGLYGLNVHKAALAAGVKVSGATVHIVDNSIDGGKILMQKAVDVKDCDTAEKLQRRIMEEAEWVILPLALEKLCSQN